ncbi:C6 finger domain-containing protein [Rutstroemia sp. NJR-2017a BVV2]|nr:C6 finger domain-containing protein [Rutstroemia sp. NJR-2017a BVV2]
MLEGHTRYSSMLLSSAIAGKPLTSHHLDWNFTNSFPDASMGDEFYQSNRYGNYQNAADQSLSFDGIPASDFYLSEEMFSLPSMFGDRPYSPQMVFSGVETGFQQPQNVAPQLGAHGVVDGMDQGLHYTHVTTSSRASAEQFSDVDSEQHEETRCHSEPACQDVQLPKSTKGHERKARASSASKTSGPPNANVFKLDVRIPALVQQENQPIASQESLSSVFEVNVNSSSKRKTRSAFTPQGKKKVEAVRNVGACIQCKFRKRTCGTSKPCHLCVRRTRDLESATLLCTRESPFVDLTVSDFYRSSRPDRVVDFDITFPVAYGQRRTMKIDGKGPTSWLLEVQVIDVPTSTLDAGVRLEIQRVSNLQPSSVPMDVSRQPETVSLLDPGSISAEIIQKWAIVYTYRFNKIHNDNSSSFLFGIAYAQQKLPHATLVANMTKLMAFNYVLHNGVKIIASTNQPATVSADYPAVRAQIETKLYQLLYNAEKSVYEELQRLVFRTSGQLAKDALVPVALVFWLLTRLHSSRADYLVNTSGRNPSSTQHASAEEPATTTTDHKHVLNLLISVLTALFRSSFPLLMNFDDKCNRDLLGGNEELLQLAKELREDLLSFKKRGYIRPWRCNKGCLKEEIDRLRDVLIE